MRSELKGWLPSETGHDKVISGYWDLLWEDGVAVELIRDRGESKWRPGGEPFWYESAIDYQTETAVPVVATPTRRELIEILRAWREREIAQRSGPAIPPPMS